MRRVVLVLLFALFLCVLIGAQDDEEWYVGKPIKDFKFIGLERISISTLEPILGPYIGNAFTYELFREIKGKLFALDFFDDIDEDALPGSDDRSSVIIQFKVHETPIIAEIRIEGNQRVSTAAIKEKTRLKIGDPVTQADVNMDAKIIRELYLQKGFPDVLVDGTRLIEEEKNEATVLYSLTEGSETKIKTIAFSGNHFASDEILKMQMQTKEQSLLAPGVFRESILQEDRDKLEKYYADNGYVDAKVVYIDKRVERDDRNNRTFLIIVVFIEEGDQFSYGGMTFEGNKVFSTQEIEELVMLQPDTALNMEKIEETYQKIVGLYTDNGYIYNIIEREEIRDDASKIISYHIKIREQGKAHIRDIILLPRDKKTKDFVINRELPFEVGDVFSVEKIRQGVLNLYNLQYFSVVDVRPEQTDIEGLMDLVINLEEQSWADFKFAFSFSGGDFPLAGQIGWADRNFLGTGITIGADLEASTIKQGLAFNFKDNYLFAKDWGGGVTLSVYHTLVKNVYQDIVPPIFTEEDVPDPFSSEDEYTSSGESGMEIPPESSMSYDTLDITLGLDTGYFLRTLVGRLGFNTGLSSTVTYLWYDPSLYRPFSKTVRDNLYQFQFVNTWGTTLYWDKRDIMHNPTEGFYFSQYVGFTGGFLFGSRDFIKLRSRADGFFTFFRVPLSETFELSLTLAAHSGISFVLPQFSGNLIATPGDLLSVDGMSIARGWPYRSGYKALWDSTVELRSPVVKQFLWWTWFFDVVGAWAEIDELGTTSWDDFYFSFGGGLRVTMPGLPIRLYLAQAFRVENGEITLMPGDFALGDLSLKFVIAFSRPGGF